MKCPVCGGKAAVIDSRADDDSVYRRRKCLECDLRFSTYEIDAYLYERKEEAVRREVQKAVDTALETMRAQIYHAFGLDEWSE